jgi:prevent-host-death family protein
MMRVAQVVEVKAKFSAYLEESKNGPIVVTKNGKPVAGGAIGRYG